MGRPLYETALEEEGNMDQPFQDFSLRVVNDGMAVVLDCAASHDEIDSLVDVVMDHLNKMKVKDPPDRERLREMLLDAIQENPSIKDLVVAKGKPAVAPEDGWIEWAGDFFNTGFVVDETTGAMDFRRPAAQLTVEEDQLLARLIPPKLGHDGINIFGETVSTDAPRIPQVRVGNNVHVDKEDRAYYAKTGGRIRWVNETLSVDPVYFISENVGLKTGHVFHTGTVVVKKDVLEGAIIEATGDVEVMGVVEAAEIHTGGNLIVRGGITRMEDLNFTVQGNVHAKFILDSKFRVNGDIVVEREIVNSHIKTRGVITIPTGRIVGGEVTALQGINAGQAGSRASVPTVLLSGEDYALPGKLFKLRRKILLAEKELSKKQTDMKGLLANRHSLPPERQEVLERIVMEIADLEESIRNMQWEIEEVQAESRKLAKQKIAVKKKLFPDTILCMGSERLIIKEEHTGPIHAELVERKIVFV